MMTDTQTDPRITRSRAKILDAATNLLAEGGQRAVTVDAVSERSGVAKSTMYRHFPSRTELLVEVLRHNLPHLPEVPNEPTFEASLRRLLQRMARELARPGLDRVLPALMTLKNSYGDVAELAEFEQAERQRLLGTVLDQGVAEGLLPDDLDIEVIGTILIGPLMLTAVHGDVSRLPEIAEELTDQFVDCWNHRQRHCPET